MIETLKDIALDVLILLAGLVIVTAEGISERGLSCDGSRVQTSSQAKP